MNFRVIGGAADGVADGSDEPLDVAGVEAGGGVAASQSTAAMWVPPLVP